MVTVRIPVVRSNGAKIGFADLSDLSPAILSIDPYQNGRMIYDITRGSDYRFVLQPEPGVPAETPTLYMITELSLGDVVVSYDQLHPDSTPVGPFDSRAEAEEWVFDKMKGRRGTCSFTISPVVKPW